MSNPLYLVVGLMVAVSYPLGVEPLRFADPAVGLRAAVAAVAGYALLAWGLHRALVPGRIERLGLARLGLRWVALLLYAALVYLFHFPLWVWEVGLEESAFFRPVVTLGPLLALFSVLALIGARFDPRRGSYAGAVLFAFRGFAGFSLAPVILMIGMDAMLERVAWLRRTSFVVPALGWGLAIGGMLLLVAGLPFLIRLAFGARALAPGPLRERLERLCRETGFRCRELLVLQTGGARLANAFIVGLAAPIRYVFFTDAIVRGMSPESLECVLAHEIAHSRRGHLKAFLAAMLGFSFLNASLLEMLEGSLHPLAISLLIAGIAVVFWVGIFGWVSRRFETEADLAAAKTAPAGAGGMAEALRSVAELNRISPWAWSWRHFSIAERIDLLLMAKADPARGEAFERRCARWRSGAATFLVVGLAVAGILGARQVSRSGARSEKFASYERADRAGELLQKERFLEARSELLLAIQGGAEDVAQVWLWLARCDRALGDPEAARIDEAEARKRGITDPRERLRIAR
jgi:Zn-dependent protease with chaperone function